MQMKKVLLLGGILLTVCLEVGCSIKKAQVTVDDVIEQTEATRTENIVGETEDEKGEDPKYETNDQVTISEIKARDANMCDTTLFVTYLKDGGEESEEWFKIQIDNLPSRRLKVNHSYQCHTYLETGEHVIQVTDDNGYSGEIEFIVGNMREQTIGYDISIKNNTLVFQDSGFYNGINIYMDDYRSHLADRHVFLPDSTKEHIEGLQYYIPVPVVCEKDGELHYKYDLDEYTWGDYAPGVFIDVIVKKIQNTEDSSQNMLHQYMERHMEAVTNHETIIAHSVKEFTAISCPGMRFVYEFTGIDNEELREILDSYETESIKVHMVSLNKDGYLYVFILSLYPFTDEMQDAICNEIIQSFEPYTMDEKKLLEVIKGTSYNVNGIQLEIKDLPGQNGVGCFITEVLSDGSETQAWAFVELRKETENTYILSIKETGGRVLEIEIPKDDIGKRP